MFFPFFSPFALAPNGQVNAGNPVSFLLANPSGKPLATAKTKGDGVVDVAAQISNSAVNNLRGAMIAISSSMTALGSRASTLFAQVAAALAFERVCRQSAAFFGFPQPALYNYAWPATWMSFGVPKGFDMWANPAQWASFWAAPFAFKPTTQNPWEAFAQVFNMLNPPASKSVAASPSSKPIPQTTTVSGPGFSFSWYNPFIAA